MKELPVIFRSIMGNKTVWFLTVFQIALTLAVLINSYASIDGYGKIITDDMGIEQQRILTLKTEILGKQQNFSSDSLINFYRDKIINNIDRLKQIPGVEGISISNGFPVSDDAQTHRVKKMHSEKISTGITLYTADENFLSTLNIEVIAGRRFETDDVNWLSNNNSIEDSTPVIIISQALADKLYPDGNSLNQKLSISDRYFTIIGIVERLPGLHPLWSNTELSAYIPGKLATSVTRFLIKVDQANNMNNIILEIENRFTKTTDTQQFFSVLTLNELKAGTLITASATLTILGFITIVLLVVSALGVYGQTSFNVTKKTKETGIKRAIGATKGDILSYYLTENWLVTSFGIGFGLIIAYLLNYILIQGLGATKIDLNFILPSILFLWLVGLASTFLPAWRAANIPPAHATRSVY